MSNFLDKLKSLFKSKDSFEMQEYEPKSLIFNNEPSNSLNDNATNQTSINDKEPSFRPNETIEKVKDFVQGTSEEIVEQGTAIWDAVKEKVHILDENTQEFRDQIKEKASETLERIENYVNTTVEKAKILEQEEKKIDQNQDGIADQAVDFGKPLSEQHGELFDKAEAWLKKQESLTKPTENLPNQSSKTITPLELPTEE